MKKLRMAGGGFGREIKPAGLILVAALCLSGASTGWSAAPANDDFVSRTNLTEAPTPAKPAALPVETLGTNLSATSETDELLHGSVKTTGSDAVLPASNPFNGFVLTSADYSSSAVPTVWYQWDSTREQPVTVSLQNLALSNQAGAHFGYTVYKSSGASPTLADLVPVVNGSSEYTQASFLAEAGASYYIGVAGIKYGSYPSQGKFIIRISVENDDFMHRIGYDGLDVMFYGTTFGGSDESFEVDTVMGGNPYVLGTETDIDPDDVKDVAAINVVNSSEETIWYNFTPGKTGVYAVQGTVFGSFLLDSIDTGYAFTLYSGGSLPVLTEETSGYFGPIFLRVTANLKAGQSYPLQIRRVIPPNRLAATYPYPTPTEDYGFIFRITLFSEAPVVSITSPTTTSFLTPAKVSTSIKFSVPNGLKAEKVSLMVSKFVDGQKSAFTTVGESTSGLPASSGTVTIPWTPPTTGIYYLKAVLLVPFGDSDGQQLPLARMESEVTVVNVSPTTTTPPVVGTGTQTAIQLAFVKQMYLDFFNRTRKAGETSESSLASQIVGGTLSRERVIRDYFLNVTETQSKSVVFTQAYYSLTNVYPSASEYRTYLGKFAQGSSLTSTLNTLLSTNSKLKSMSSSDLVRQLFRSEYGRSPVTLELNYWNKQINSQGKAATVIAFLKKSPKNAARFQAAQVVVLYQSLLRRAPTASEITANQSSMGTLAGKQKVISLITQSSAFKARFK
jgi:hypothetical protein